MESDFSIRNELDSVVRGSDTDANKYKTENPFSKLVGAFNSPKDGSAPNAANNFTSPHNDDGWKAQAFFASSVAKQQADVAHRAIDLMHRSLLGETGQVNYWKYVAIASLGAIAIILFIYWKSSVRLKLVPEKELPEL
jgi:hypothetical protein